MLTLFKQIFTWWNHQTLGTRLHTFFKGKFVGKDETGQRCEIFELEDHCFYVGVQYHPEFKSRPGRPSPPFLGLLMAASGLEL